MSFVKDIGFAIGLAGVILAPIVVISGLAITGMAVYQHTRKKGTA